MSLIEDNLVNAHITYTLECEGKFFLVQNVPARVNKETGEQFFSPATVERLQQIILGKQKPRRTIETPVYEYTE